MAKLNFQKQALKSHARETGLESIKPYPNRNPVFNKEIWLENCIPKPVKRFSKKEIKSLMLTSNNTPTADSVPSALKANVQTRKCAGPCNKTKQLIQFQPYNGRYRDKNPYTKYCKECWSAKAKIASKTYLTVSKSNTQNIETAINKEVIQDPIEYIDDEVERIGQKINNLKARVNRSFLFTLLAFAYPVIILLLR